MENQLLIRKATKDDAASILGLIIDLAIYEKEPAAVKTTIQDYEAVLSTGQVQCLLAEYGTEGIVGLALFYPIFSTWSGRALYLEDFFVKENYRKLGIGKTLFEAYLTEAKAQNVKLAKWQVLDWNELGKDFYRKYNAEAHLGWENWLIRF